MYQHKNILILLILLMASILIPGPYLFASTNLAGRILLQVEEHGEAWYVHPVTGIRYYLGRPDDAFAIMREQGIGISNADLRMVPLATSGYSGVDSDQDGIIDQIENALGTDQYDKDSDKDGWDDRSEIEAGYDPLGPGTLPLNIAFTNQHLGQIFLQVESKGEAWYINPVDQKRYYLGRPIDAWNLMRSFGLGISNRNLSLIKSISEENKAVIIIKPVPAVNTESDYFDLRLMEKIVHTRINQERVNRGISELRWNEDLANVAREHSLNLALENEDLSGFGVTCDYPIIHHEGFDFGAYNIERLHNRGIYYFGRTGENIALVSGADVLVRFQKDDPLQYKVDECSAKRDTREKEFKQALENADGEEKLKVVEDEINIRRQAFRNENQIEIAEIAWHDSEVLAWDMVDGWLRSEGHLKNIIEEDFDEAGIGIAVVNGYVISTQIFISRVDCGYKNGPCCEESGYYPYCYISLTCEKNICIE